VTRVDAGDPVLRLLWEAALPWYQLGHGSVLYPPARESGDVWLEKPATYAWGDGHRYENPELGREIQSGHAVAVAYAERIAGMNRPTDPALAVPCPERVGTPEWYDFRVADHLRRGGRTDDKTTGYYLDYGKKYGLRFSEVEYPKLTDAGKRWCEAVGVCLHVALEMEILADAAKYARLERENDGWGLRALAYDTHADGYVAAGVARLPPADLAIIFSTPDLVDLVSPSGIWQAFETAPSVVKEELKKLLGSQRDTARQQAEDKIVDRGET
jgi:hypothetical protein